MKLRESKGISIITATYNSENTLKRLIDSLTSQTDSHFEWVVADGGSTDSTVDIISRYEQELNINMISAPDFGVYDGINRALAIASHEFYIVIGSDDFFDVDAIRNFKSHISDDVDIISSSTQKTSPITKFFNNFDAISPMRKYIFGHAVHSCFRKSLHDKFGLYSKRFPIAADLYFIRKAILGGARVKLCSFDPGFFSKDGLSSVDNFGALTESMRVQRETGVNTLVAVLIFCLKIFKNRGDKKIFSNE